MGQDLWLLHCWQILIVLPGQCGPVREFGVLVSGLAAIGSGSFGMEEFRLKAWVDVPRAESGLGEDGRAPGFGWGCGVKVDDRLCRRCWRGMGMMPMRGV